jgi:type III secretion protein N (ATPase)
MQSLSLIPKSKSDANIRNKLAMISKKLSSVDRYRQLGRITEITPSRLVTNLSDVSVGETCELRNPGQSEVMASQVISIQNGHAILAPLERVDGLSPSTEAVGTGEAYSIDVGDELIGRVVDGLGRPIDQFENKLRDTKRASIAPKSESALDRPIINDVFETGIKSIDGFNTVGQGQRMAIFGEAGAGKSTLLAMLARHSTADVVVLAMIGERGREINEFLERQLPSEVRERCIVVASTSDRPAMERIMAAHCATTIAEHFRSKGKNVLLLFDSVTRYARALREVGLAAGEQALRSGFTPSVYAELPRLVERTGKTKQGAITAFFTVLVENDGVNDPVAEEVASLTDGHLVLDASLARSGIYPAINTLKSKSRLMNEIGDRDAVDAANQLRRLMSKYDEMELLVQVGEYQSGADPVADRAIELHETINDLLRQHTHDFVKHGQTVSMMKEILDE